MIDFLYSHWITAKFLFSAESLIQASCEVFNLFKEFMQVSIDDNFSFNI